MNDEAKDSSNDVDRESYGTKLASHLASKNIIRSSSYPFAHVTGISFDQRQETRSAYKYKIK